ncbi:dTMP kinase [Streptomyces noursei]|uniref:dTMP kinase n=1 Tax=Streptomyces noursei TaxID=1971 RepID=UPI002154F99A|nr:dTMP kinase [Streptomyces noursei]
MFITLDGPSGVGKSTTAKALQQLLTARSVAVRTTMEPTTSSLGAYTRAHASELHGHTLACLVAAQRYEHIDTVIAPALKAGETIVCDRYLASTLVLQRLDGVPLPFLLDINRDILLPDLAVILTAQPGLIADRIAQRGIRHRFHLDPTAPRREVDLYENAAQILADKGVPVLVIDSSNATPAEVVAQIASEVPGPPVASSATSIPAPFEEP